MTNNDLLRFGARAARLLCAVLFLCCSGAFTPAGAATGGMTLLTEPTSTRAIALESTTLLGEPFRLTTPVPFSADNRTRLIFFAMNLDLLAGESAKALTADAEDASKNSYVLAVEDVRPVPGFEWMSAITVRLADNLVDPGDVLVRINLHGVASNRVRVAIGHKGGGPADDPGSVPTPAPTVAPAPTPTPTPNPFNGAATTPDTVRFLEQSSFGPTAAEVTRVQGMGFRAYLNEQFSAAASSYPTLTLMPTDNSQGCPTGSAATCLRDNYTSYPLQMKFYQNALNTQAGNDQLRQRVSWALHQILVVSGSDINMPSWLSPYLQKIDQNAFGNFRTLLGDITLNPAMGNYLDMLGNNKSGPNENYAREILQLFSVGLDKLNLDGTPQQDAQGNRIPTYDQTTITNFARVFTGWVLAAQKQTVINGTTFNVFNYQDPMRVTSENNHDTAQKTLLNGQVLPAGQTAATELNAALDNIFNHPNVGPFIGRQLIQHLVTSNPSPAYVERVASVFNNNCAGLYPDSPCTNVRGDLKAVVRAILLDPEARGDEKTDPNYGRLREPAQFITNILRVANAASDGYLIPNSLALDQDVLKPPTVFSYYPADYTVPGTDLAGPQFGILSTSTALRRANFVNTILLTGIPAGTNAPTGTPPLALSALTPLAANPAALVDELDRLMMHGAMPAAMKSSIVTAVSGVSASSALDRARMAFYLVASSSQYQVER
ncbi:MAG TPA: DUF1800 domain-containing protein [Pyrinomonadaceae bacterium]